MPIVTDPAGVREEAAQHEECPVCARTLERIKANAPIESLAVELSLAGWRYEGTGWRSPHDDGGSAA